MDDPETGERRVVQLGSPRRLRTIFDVNMRTAYQAGRWERMQRDKQAFPFVRYTSVDDRRVRPQHRAWHGTIKPIDDPWWDTHYPPCGWRCRCTAVPVNARMMERRGWEVTEKPPAFLPQRYRNPRTGEISSYEAGIDPGFSYNVGKAYLQDLAARPLPAKADDVAEEDDTAASAVDLGDAEESFLAVLGVEPDQAERGKVFTDKGGWPLAISSAWFKAPGGAPALPGGADAGRLELAGRAIAEPDEIYWRWVLGEKGKALLFRRYIARIDGTDVVVDVGRDGWRFLTSAAPGFDLEQLRAGELAYSKI
jgi:SPP1 gp7 family putative phage head morphogenesis protein